MTLQINTETKAQARANKWAVMYQSLRNANPDASNWLICQTIAKHTKHTPQAVFNRLKQNNII